MLAEGQPALEKETPLPLGDPAMLSWNPFLTPSAEPGGEEKSRPRPVQGRVVLLTSTVNKDWNTWALSPSFLPMMQQVLLHAISGRLGQQSVVVGDRLEDFLPLGDAGLDVKIFTPDNRPDQFTKIADHEEISVLHWNDTDISGIYCAVVGRHPREHLFAVNVPAASEGQQESESDLRLSRSERDAGGLPRLHSSHHDHRRRLFPRAVGRQPMATSTLAASAPRSHDGC